ncbi:MAG: B12-binding domain-containing radical SAM protein [Pseudonocardiaceae bacterium]
MNTQRNDLQIITVPVLKHPDREVINPFTRLAPNVYDLDVLLLNPIVSYRSDMNVGTMGVPDDYLVRCINPGILSIATWLNSRGHTVSILDFLDGDGSVEPLDEFFKCCCPKVVGISCMTGFAYLHALRLAAHVRGLSPGSLIAFGGQHVGPQAVDVLADGPEIDVVALYEGELVMESFVDVVTGQAELRDIPGIAWREGGEILENRSYPRLVPLHEIPPLRYRLYPRYETFAPFVEESRGCYAKCEYCITPFTNNYRIRRKPTGRILEEIDLVIDTWGASLSGRPVALLAATFGAQVAPTLDVIRGLADRTVDWTTEVRADSLLLDHLAEISGSGASAIFIGMESASRTQLTRMDKTRNADRYLKRMATTLKTASLYPDLLLKTGLLFYIGESAETMRETMTFLLSMQDYVRWVSVSPLFVFGGTPLHRRFAEYAERYGASLHSEGFWGMSRTFPCNVSREFNFQSMIEGARFIERIFRAPEAYDRVFTRKRDAPRTGVW